MIGMGSVRQAIGEGKQKTLRETRERRRGPITDTVAEMSWRACFNEDKRQRTSAASKPAGVTRIKNEKVGRNDPCFCGSGKKYKKCCGR